MEIYIIRHTKVKNTSGICYGQIDVELEDSFEQDVKLLKEKLPQHFNKIYSSSAKRCKTLAQQFNMSDVEYTTQIMEMNFGDWEGKNWNEINQDELNVWMNDFVNVKATNGENLNDLFKRVSTFLEDLSKTNYEKILIVTHAGVIRCFWAYILQFPLSNIFKMNIGYGEVYKIGYKNNNYSVF